MRPVYRPDPTALTPAALTPADDDVEPSWDAGPLGAKLSVKEMTFIREYLTDLNATGAARRAHYRWPNSDANKLINRPHVREALQAAMDERAERLGIRADEVVAEIATLSFACIADVLEWGEQAGPDGTPERGVWLRERAAAPEAVWRGVQEVRFAGGAVHVRMADKLTALSLLSRHLGLLRPPEAREEAETSVEAAIAAARSAGFQTHLKVFLEGLPSPVFREIKGLLDAHYAAEGAAKQARLGQG